MGQCQLASKAGGSGMKATELWTNSKPTSSFATQTVTLSDSISNYDYIMFETYRTTTDNVLLTSIIKTSDFKQYSNIYAEVAFTGYLNGSYPVVRIVMQSNTQATNTLTFSDCVQQKTNTTYSTSCVPIKIYGIKGTIKV